MGVSEAELQANGYEGIARDLPEGTDTSNYMQVEM
jgi:hypothetical protein